MTTAKGFRVLLLPAAVILARGQEPLRMLPNNYRLVYENEYVRVIDVFYRPHEKLPLHNHSDKPTVYVYLTDSGPVRFTHVEEHPFSIVRRPQIAGTFRVSPGRLEKHEVENLGDIPSEFLRVELKQVPLGFQGDSFRSAKSFDLTHSGLSTEFPGPFVRIERVVATPQQPTQLKPSPAPALLLSLSAASLQLDAGSPSRTLQRAQVFWISAHHSVHVSSTSAGLPAHLLRILFLPQP